MVVAQLEYRKEGWLSWSMGKTGVAQLEYGEQGCGPSEAWGRGGGLAGVQ